MRELTEAERLQLAAMGAAGARLDDAAVRLGMSRRALGRIFERDERARMAWGAGRAELHEKLASKLIEKALGGEVVPLLFALKSVFGYREGEPLDGGEGRGPLVQINLPGPLDREGYAKLIEAKPVALAPVSEAGGD